MRLLVITQKIDVGDDMLGFFHSWVEMLSNRYEKVEVICLQEGKHSLPANVKVYSLGKEKGFSKLRYILNFYKYLWRLRSEYDAVFVHMNQEYVVLGWPLWKALGRKVYFWRNHPIGGLSTKLAVFFSDVVFCTSPFAYVAPYKKTVLMPVGIDTDQFAMPEESQSRKKAVLFLGRIAPIKKPEVLIEATSLLKDRGSDMPVAFVGSAKKEDQTYFESLKRDISARGLSGLVSFEPGVTYAEVPKMFGQYEAYVNTTPLGSMDKTIFEAMACGAIVATSNKALEGALPAELLFKEGSGQELAESLSYTFSLDEGARRALRARLRSFVVENHSLEALMNKLHEIIR